MFFWQSAMAAHVQQIFSHFHTTGYDMVTIYQCIGFCNYYNYLNKFMYNPLYIIYIK
jgi:hypothetical protein